MKKKKSVWKQMFCKHKWVIKVYDSEWNEQVSKCEKCDKVKSEYLD